MERTINNSLDSWVEKDLNEKIESEKLENKAKRAFAEKMNTANEKLAEIIEDSESGYETSTSFVSSINARLLGVYGKLLNRSDKKAKRAKRNAEGSKEAFKNRKYITALKLGAAAALGYTAGTVQIAAASKLANSTGLSADLAMGIENMGHVGGGTFSLDQASATSPTTPTAHEYAAAYGTSSDPESLAKEVQGTNPSESVDSLVKEVERTTGLDVADGTTPSDADKIDIVGGVANFVEDAKDKIEDALSIDTAEAAESDSGANSGDSDKPADYNRNEQNSHDRMSTEGAFDGEDRGPKRLDNHVLAKIENNPTLMAAVLEVHESGSMDANFSLADVNEDNASYAVGGEHGTYSEKGEKALETLKHTWDNGEQGKLLSQSEVSKLMEHYNFINHGVDAGDYENAIDNKMYGAGAFDYRPDLGDQIYAKELGNGHTVYFKVNEKDPSRDCLNVQTLVPRSESVDTPAASPTPPVFEKDTPPQDEFVPEKQPEKEPEKQPEKEPEKQPEKEPEKQPEKEPEGGKRPEDSTNRNPALNPDANSNGHIAGPGELKPATQPPEDYVAPAPPVVEPSTPRQPETISPVETNPSTGQSANGQDGINNAGPDKQPDKSGV